MSTDNNNSFGSAHSVEIIRKSNHLFTLNLEEMKSIFEAEDIRNRHVVVISIAGPFRCGKSFLLNFFLRYLYAQVGIQSNNFFFCFKRINVYSMDSFI